MSSPSPSPHRGCNRTLTGRAEPRNWRWPGRLGPGSQHASFPSGRPATLRLRPIPLCCEAANVAVVTIRDDS